jgi:hypothetical protein
MVNFVARYRGSDGDHAHVTDNIVRAGLNYQFH